jgi:hypothetical protein
MNHLASLNLLSAHELLQVAFFNPLNLLAINPQSIAPVEALFFDEQRHAFVLHA